MKDEWVKHAKIKWLRTNKKDLILILQERFNQHTGEKEESIERPVNVPGLNKRIATLTEELNALSAIKDKITRGDFDVIEDQRTIHKKH